LVDETQNCTCFFARPLASFRIQSKPKTHWVELVETLVCPPAS
jgi:hypothetical protein